MLKFKEGVKIEGLQPQMLVALDVATEEYDKFSRDCVVTGALKEKKNNPPKGNHGDFSHHYKGLAVDLRIRHLPDPNGNPGMIKRKLQHRLGEEYQIILESTHIHVEFDPRQI